MVAYHGGLFHLLEKLSCRSFLWKLSTNRSDLTRPFSRCPNKLKFIVLATKTIHWAISNGYYPFLPGESSFYDFQFLQIFLKLLLENLKSFFDFNLKLSIWTCSWLHMNAYTGRRISAWWLCLELQKLLTGTKTKPLDLQNWVALCPFQLECCRGFSPRTVYYTPSGNWASPIN